MMSASEIQKGLDMFYGTEVYHRLSLFPVVATDGIRWLAENAECFWLIDIVAGDCMELDQREGFLSFYLKVIDRDYSHE